MPMQRLLLSFLLIFSGYLLSAQNTPRGLDIAIFPNPTTEFISINDANDLVGSIAVYSLVGKKLASFTFHANEKYDVGDLPKGMYLIHVLDKQGQMLSTQRLNKR